MKIYTLKRKVKMTRVPLDLVVVLLLVTGLLSFYLGQQVDHVLFPMPTAKPEPCLTPAPTATHAPYDFSAPVPEGEPVEDGWFSDAVFIGDSRTDGLRLYGGGKEGEFLCYKGLTCFEVGEEAFVKRGKQRVTALEALAELPCKKLYIMLGLNEIGYPVETFARGYEKMLDEILAVQPEAEIYLQPIVPVNDGMMKKAGKPSYFNNQKIGQFNAEIARLAQEKELYFVAVDEILTDEEGQLPVEKTTDGAHFTRDWYEAWYDYLKTHTVPEEVHDEKENAVPDGEEMAVLSPDPSSAPPSVLRR